MKKFAFVAVLALLCAGTAMAETYTWEDESGTLNFTEDLSQVPKKYRKKVKVRGDMGASGYEGTSSSVETTYNGDATPAAAGKAQTAEPEKKTYGGKSGEEWRREFAYLKEDARVTDDRISELNTRLADTSKMSRSEYLSIQASLKSLTFHKAEVAKKLDALNEAASRAKVPAEYR